MFEIDAGPRRAMARFEDAVLGTPARLRSVHGATAPGPGAQGVRLAMAG